MDRSDLWPASERLTTLTIRLPRATKSAVKRHARLRTEHEGREVTTTQAARDLLEHALAVVTETGATSQDRSLIDDLMASILFARKALELVLSAHDGLAHNLLRDARKEVALRKNTSTKTQGGTTDE